MTRLPLLFLTAALVTACAQTEPADSNAGDDLQQIAQPTIDSAEDPTSPGNWEAGAQGEAQSVAFRNPDGETIFTIRCDLRGGLVVQRPGLIARGNLALMQLRTADVVRRLAVNAATGEQPQVEARVPYNDEVIASLMRFDEPLEVRYEGLETLVLPPNPLVADLVRTCQQTTSAGGATAGQPASPAEPSATQQGEAPATTAEPAAPAAQPQQP